MNKQKILNALTEFVSIQSVSVDPERFPEIRKAVDMLSQKLKSMGFVVKTISKGKNPPLIVASREAQISDHKSQIKTIGIYGHYDVQPEDPYDEWNTEPFKLTLKNGKMWGRGVADNKGHIVQNIVAIEELIAEDSLNSNIVFIIEGEEEKGIEYLEGYLQEVQDVLKKVDVFFVTDVNMHSSTIPSIFYGLRGIAYFELSLTIGSSDLHSGTYGNRVYNPLNLLSEIIASMKDVSTGKILIPGFYDDVREISDKEHKMLLKTKKTQKEEMSEAGLYVLAHTDNPDGFLLPVTQPSCDVHGIWGGYSGPGAKTVIPKTASSKFSFRLVEHQDPNEIEKLVRRFIEQRIPKGVTYELKSYEACAPFYTDINNEFVIKTAQKLKEVFKNEPLLTRSGGSIPVAEMFQRLFKKPVVLTGFTLPDENLHAPNENFDEGTFWKGIEALQKIYGSI